MRPTHALLFLTLLGVTQCKQRPSASDVDVTGGQAVDASHWLAKSVVMLGKGCSGVIISPYHILTAGHCQQEAAGEVSFGPERKTALRLNKNAVVTHPDYKRVDASNLSHDLAVVTLRAPIPSGFEPIPLGEPKKLLSRGQYTVGGFGITATNAGDQGRLRMLTPKKVKREAHAKIYALTFNKQQGVCGGDSGSGLILEEKGIRRLVGISSMANCEHGAATYVDLESYRDWIEGVVAQKVFKKDSVKTKTYAVTDVTLAYASDAVAASHRFSLPAAENERVLSMEIKIEAAQNKPGWLRFFFEAGPGSNLVSFLQVPTGESVPPQHHVTAEKLTDFVGIPARGNWKITVRREDMAVVPRIDKLEFIVQTYEE